MEIDGVRVRAFSVVKIDANKNSFHEKMMLKIAVVANPGAARGSTIRRNAP